MGLTPDGVPFYSEGFGIRFYRTDGTSWVANFYPGSTDLKAVYELEATANLLIIAFGMCYIMNPDREKPVSVFGGDCETVLFGKSDRFILQRNTKLTFLESNGEHWDTQEIGWFFYGLKDLKVENDIVTGFAFDPIDDKDEWVPFSYDLNSKMLTGGSVQRYENCKRKPWWKIW